MRLYTGFVMDGHICAVMSGHNPENFSIYMSVAFYLTEGM